MSTNVCQRLLRHESGLLKSIKLRNEIGWTRTRAIELSRFRDVSVNQDNDDDEEEDAETNPRGHSAAITALDLDAQDGRYLLAGGADGSLYIHDLANFSGEPRCSSKLVGQIKPIPAPQVPAPQPRGSHSSRRRPERTEPDDRHGHFQSVQTVQWFPGDSAIFVTSSMDQRLLVWDANTLTVAEEFNINKLVFCHQLSQPPSTLVAVASASNHVRLIDLKSGSSTHELRGHTDSVLTVRWSGSRDHLLASGCYAGQVLLWDVRRARSCLQALDLDNISKSSADKMKGKADTSRKAHCGSTNGLAFCDDGLHLISYGGFEAKMRRWDLTSGRNTKTPFIKLQKRSSSSSSSSKNKICVKMSLSPSFGRRDGIIFVPEGSNIAAVDVNTGKLHQRLRGHFHGVRCTVYNDRAHELYSGGGDRNILIWDSNPIGPYDEHLKLKGDDGGVEKRQEDNLLQDNWSSSSESDD